MRARRSPSAPPVPQEASRADRYFIFAVLVFTAITYLNVLRFGFVYDDNGQIGDNPFIRSWHYVPQYFVASVWKHMFPLGADNYYRPLFLVWLRLNYAVFNIRPFGWHITALLLHLLVTWLVYLVVCKMTGRPGLGWLTALIFGVHPIHHEVVAWISGGSESLFAALFLAAFLAYLYSTEGYRTRWTTLSCGLHALALLSKETAIVLPALVFAHCWIAGGPGEAPKLPEYGRRFGRAFATIAVYIPVSLIYLVLRFKVLGGFSHPVTDLAVPTWLRTAPSILFFYLRHWFFPVRLGEFYDLFVHLRTDVWHVILPAGILLAVAVAIWMARGRLRQLSQRPGF